MDNLTISDISEEEGEIVENDENINSLESISSDEDFRDLQRRKIELELENSFLAGECSSVFIETSFNIAYTSFFMSKAIMVRKIITRGVEQNDLQTRKVEKDYSPEADTKQLERLPETDLIERRQCFQVTLFLKNEKQEN